MNKFREKIYNILKGLSEKSKNVWLAAISFSESSFFPIPVDPFLMLSIFSNPKKWIKYTTIVTLFSVAGGLFGYLIGFFFFDVIGEWLINTYSLSAEFEITKELFNQNAFWAVFVSAFTPLPYKIFTLASGFFVVNVLSFIVASILGRAIRFFLVGSISYFLGKKFAKTFIKYFDVITIVIIIAVLLYIIF